MAAGCSRTDVAYTSVFPFLVSVSFVLHGCGNGGSSRSSPSFLNNGACEGWCEGDQWTVENGQSHKERHCGGDMSDRCGACPYCGGSEPADPPSGTCEGWCEGDQWTVENGKSHKERHCGGDMSDQCGGCPHCGGSAPADPPSGDDDCCAHCAGHPHCSPQSGHCYDDKPWGKDYYLDCGEGTPSDPPSGNGGPLTVMSYNLMSWCTFGKCQKTRLRNIVGLIKKYRPAILGTQEHGDGNAPYDEVKAILLETGLTHRGSGTYYDASVVKPVGEMRTAAVLKDERHISGQLYEQIGCSGANCQLHFYNTHWGFEDYSGQANKVVSFIQSSSNGKPSVLTGDFNVWEDKSGIQHIESSLGMTEVSSKADSWCSGGKVDFILASAGKFTASGAVTDNTNCNADKDPQCPDWTCSSKTSDHKLVKVDLAIR